MMKARSEECKYEGGGGDDEEREERRCKGEEKEKGEGMGAPATRRAHPRQLRPSLVHGPFL